MVRIQIPCGLGNFYTEHWIHIIINLLIWLPLQCSAMHVYSEVNSTVLNVSWAEKRLEKNECFVRQEGQRSWEKREGTKDSGCSYLCASGVDFLFLFSSPFNPKCAINIYLKGWWLPPEQIWGHTRERRITKFTPGNFPHLDSSTVHLRPNAS